MINCQTFRTHFEPGTEVPEMLEHIRTCDACLDHAAHIDPDMMFRALGGDIVPPGGVDAFVGDVMREVRLRATDDTVNQHRVLSWPRRLAIAAAVAVGIFGASLVYQSDPTQPASSTRMAKITAPVAAVANPIQLATKPVVETYDSNNATIVEVPTNGTEDVQVVMIFDENLPADL